MFTKILKRILRNLKYMGLEELKSRLLPVVIYLNWGNLMLFLQIIIIMIYTSWAIHYHKKYNDEKDKQELEFQHEVLWGKNGTSGTFQKMLTLLFTLLLVYGAKKFLAYIVKSNLDIVMKDLAPPKRTGLRKVGRKIEKQFNLKEDSLNEQFGDVYDKFKSAFGNVKDKVSSTDLSPIKDKVSSMDLSSMKDSASSMDLSSIKDKVSSIDLSPMTDSIKSYIKKPDIKIPKMKIPKMKTDFSLIQQKPSINLPISKPSNKYSFINMKPKTSYEKALQQNKMLKGLFQQK